ncbi:MAG: A/G-specific adenine glycosylase [Verrucomicrobiaceae bacterium]|nr:A/G-specific adenine glycosylase [Verrucomicrobiaceae bacterium]
MASSRDSKIVSKLEAWFEHNGKDYPWRQTTDPYAILVSEIMLQQTQITTVLERGYYSGWMKKFPTFAALAAASEDDVLKAWEGLGYYRRARNLQKLAQAVIGQHAGQFPSDTAAMRALPGVGPYTAGAVASFAFDLAAPLVDGNVARVLSRLNNDATPVDTPQAQKQLWQTANNLVLLAGSPRRFNSALMELGQTHCRPEKPACLLCPIKAHCTADNPESLPKKSKRIALTEVIESAVLSVKDGAILLEQETGPRRTGLWRLPRVETVPTGWERVTTLTYGITRYKVRMTVFRPTTPLPPAEHQRYIPFSHLPTVALASPYKKALNLLL